LCFCNRDGKGLIRLRGKWLSSDRIFLNVISNCQSNASSGMGIAGDCKDIFLELQRKKTHRYVIFKIDEKQKQ
ncbi:unnamed protein product, partial [Musa banksii]